MAEKEQATAADLKFQAASRERWRGCQLYAAIDHSFIWQPQTALPRDIDFPWQSLPATSLATLGAAPFLTRLAGRHHISCQSGKQEMTGNGGLFTVAVPAGVRTQLTLPPTAESRLCLLQVGDGAELILTTGNQTAHLILLAVAGRDALIDIRYHLDAIPLPARFDALIALNGAKAGALLRGAGKLGEKEAQENPAASKQAVEAVWEIHHAAPETFSRQLWRSAHRSNANVRVNAKTSMATGTGDGDGEQSLKAMLRDQSSTAFFKPELDIRHDQVKCSHGAAVGELDRKKLFYLQARGLPLFRARDILETAFVAEAFCDIQE